MRKLFLFPLLMSSVALGAQTVISNVYVQSSTATTATIVWTTNTPSTSQILYGTSIFLQYSNNVNNSLVTSHTSTLTVLNANQSYYFAAVSVDGSGHSAQSSTYEFALCGVPIVPVTGTINQFYYSGTYTLTWNPPAGSGGTPTLCGQTFPTTITGTVNRSGSFSTQVADSMKVTPGPGAWTVAVADIGNISPISVNLALSSLTQDISTQLQAAAAGTGLVGVIANTNTDHCWPAFVCSGGGGSGTVNPGTTGQIAYYPANGSAVSGETLVPIASGGNNSGTAPGAVSNLLSNPAIGEYILNCTSTSACAPLAFSGGGGIPGNTVFVFTGTSMNDDDAHVLSPAITVTGWTTSGGVTTLTNSATNGFVAGQWVSTRALTGWPGLPSFVALGTGYTLFQVLPTGLSNTQFEINTSLISPGTCSSACGSAYSASPYLPFATTAAPNMPTAAPNNTYMYLSNPVTIVGTATNYTALFQAISPSVMQRPGYLYIDNPNNDAASCESAATIEAAYQSLFSQAHADGWIITVGSPTATNWSQFSLGCTTAFNTQAILDGWLRGQGEQTVQAVTPGSTEYWDIYSDVGAIVNDPLNANLIAQSNYAFGPTGAKLASIQLATDFFNDNGTALSRDGWVFGTGTTDAFSSVNGYMYVPSQDSSWQWWNAARTAKAAELDSASGNFSIAGQFYAGSPNCGGGSWILCVGDQGDTGRFLVDPFGDIQQSGSGSTAQFTATTVSSLKDTGAAASSGNLFCLQSDDNGNITNTGLACGSGGSGIPWPTFTGLAKYSGSDSWVTPTYADVVALFGSGSCSGFLKNDGTCSTPSGGTYPSANTLGLANGTGTGWTTPSYTSIVALFGSGSCSGFLKNDGTCGTVTSNVQNGSANGEVPQWNNALSLYEPSFIFSANDYSFGSLTMQGILPFTCNDTSGSSTAQSCTMLPLGLVGGSFTLGDNECILYNTPNANSTTSLTLSINGETPKSVRVESASGWTSTLSTSPASIPANTPMMACTDSADTNYNVSMTGIIPASGGTAAPIFGYGNPLGASTPVVVQSKGSGGIGGGGSTSLTFASNVSAGNVVFFLYNSGNASPSPSVTDTLGTTYTQLVNFNNSSSTYNVAIFAGVLTASGANTLTFTDDRAMGQAYEVSGVTATIDNALTSTTGTTLTLSVTPNSVNDWLLTFMAAEYDTSASQSVSSPWSSNLSGNSTQYYNVLDVAYQVAGAIAAYPVTWTITDGDTANAGLISFKAASTPVAGAQGQLYFQTSTTPYTEWVYNSGAWHQVQ